MKTFGGSAFFIDRDDINTDEIIPAKYLTEISKTALKQHLLEDLLIDGRKFDNSNPGLAEASVIISRKNFGCGSSREHAVWAFEVNNINVIIAESFARIFRQNMFNCGILAIELSADDIQAIIEIKGTISVQVELSEGVLTVKSDDKETVVKKINFSLNDFDKDLVSVGGWLEYADRY